MYVSKFFSHNSKSNPVRMYSACSPQVSMLVNTLKSLMQPFSTKLLTLLANLSISMGLTPKFELMLSSRLGIGFFSNSSNMRHVLCCSRGSPPVMRRMVRVFLSSGHHFQNAFTYGLSSSSYTLNQSISLRWFLTIV